MICDEIEKKCGCDKGLMMCKENCEYSYYKYRTKVKIGFWCGVIVFYIMFIIVVVLRPSFVAICVIYKERRVKCVIRRGGRRG